MTFNYFVTINLHLPSFIGLSLLFSKTVYIDLFVIFIILFYNIYSFVVSLLFFRS